MWYEACGMRQLNSTESNISLGISFPEYEKCHVFLSLVASFSFSIFEIFGSLHANRIRHTDCFLNKLNLLSEFGLIFILVAVRW